MSELTLKYTDAFTDRFSNLKTSEFSFNLNLPIYHFHLVNPPEPHWSIPAAPEQVSQLQDHKQTHTLE